MTANDFRAGACFPVNENSVSEYSLILAIPACKHVYSLTNYGNFVASLENI